MFTLSSNSSWYNFYIGTLLNVCHFSFIDNDYDLMIILVVMRMMMIMRISLLVMIKMMLIMVIIMDVCDDVSKIHSYNTRAASKPSFYLPKARTNYGKFNIRFQGPKIWNLISHKSKSFSLYQFKKKIKDEIVCKY